MENYFEIDISKRDFCKWGTAGLSTLMVGCGGDSSSDGISSNTISTPLTSSLAAFWVSQPVDAGETMLITAGGLETNSTVEVALLTDDPAGSPLTTSTSTLKWVALECLTLTLRSLTATLPIGVKGGVYALRLNNSQGHSPAILVNAPDPWFVQGDQGSSATPGGWIAISGTCLERAGGSTPRAVLVSSGTIVSDLPLAERISDSTGYALRFAIPADVVSGNYELYLHNGRGGPDAWVKYTHFVTSQVDTITIASPPVWKTDVADVSQQSGADDDARFANAITALRKDGGVLYVPAGTYTLTQSLVLPPNTVLRGDGSETTTIQWPSVAGGSLVKGTSKPNGKWGAYSFAIEGVTLQAGSSFAGYVVHRWGTTDIGWFKDMKAVAPALRVNNQAPTALFVRECSNTLIDNVVLDADTSLFCHKNVSYLRLTNSTLHWRNTSAYFSSDSHNFLIERNKINLRGNADENGWTSMHNPNPGMWYTMFYATGGYAAGSYLRDTLWCKNESTRDNISTTMPPYIGYTADGGNGIYLGGVENSSGTTLTLKGATILYSPKDPNTKLSYHLTGAVVQVLDGTGAGQWRYVIGAKPEVSTITIDRGWDIALDGTSVISIINLQGRLLMVDNHFAQERLLQDYFITLDSIRAGNLLGISDTSQTLISWMGTHYSGTSPGWHFQMLDNTVTTGTLTKFISTVNGSTPGYSGVVAAAHVMRNNKNTSGNDVRFAISSQAGAFADVLIENNQATMVELKTQYSQTSTEYPMSGVLIKDNKTLAGAPSRVSNPLPSGVVVIP